MSANTGPIASAAWLAARELYPKDPKWHAVATLPAEGARFQLEIYAEEWGFVFEIADKQSWIRITDVPFVHGRDDHGLLSRTPPLRQIGKLVRSLESAHAIKFDRDGAQIDTTIADGVDAIRTWIASL